MREFGTSIYTRPRARVRPTYHRTSWLTILRKERRVNELQEQVNRMTTDALLYGAGIGLSRISAHDFWRKPEPN